PQTERESKRCGSSGGSRHAASWKTVVVNREYVNDVRRLLGDYQQVAVRAELHLCWPGQTRTQSARRTGQWRELAVIGQRKTYAVVWGAGFQHIHEIPVNRYTDRHRPSG